MTKEAKFQADYKALATQMRQVKQKLRLIKKELTPLVNRAHAMWERGDKTMYDEGKGRMITPKFPALPRMMEDLEYWMGLGDDIRCVIESL